MVHVLEKDEVKNEILEKTIASSDITEAHVQKEIFIYKNTLELSQELFTNATHKDFEK